MSKQGKKRGVMRGFRRKSAVEMLQEQLKLGTKTKKGTYDNKIPLTDRDKVRINREITVLKERI